MSNATSVVKKEIVDYLNFDCNVPDLILLLCSGLRLSKTDA